MSKGYTGLEDAVKDFAEDFRLSNPREVDRGVALAKREYWIGDSQLDIAGQKLKSDVIIEEIICDSEEYIESIRTGINHTSQVIKKNFDDSSTRLLGFRKGKHNRAYFIHSIHGVSLDNVLSLMNSSPDVTQKDRIKLASLLLEQIKKRHSKNMYQNNLSTSTIYLDISKQEGIKIIFMSNFAGRDSQVIDISNPYDILRRKEIKDSTFKQQSNDVFSVTAILYEVLTGEKANFKEFRIDEPLKEKYKVEQVAKKDRKGFGKITVPFMDAKNYLFTIPERINKYFCSLADETEYRHFRKLNRATGSKLRKTPYARKFIDIWFPTRIAVVMRNILDEYHNQKLFGGYSGVNKGRQEKRNADIDYLMPTFRVKNPGDIPALEKILEDNTEQSSSQHLDYETLFLQKDRQKARPRHGLLRYGVPALAVLAAAGYMVYQDPDIIQKTMHRLAHTRIVSVEDSVSIGELSKLLGKLSSAGETFSADTGIDSNTVYNIPMCSWFPMLNYLRGRRADDVVLDSAEDRFELKDGYLIPLMGEEAYEGRIIRPRIIIDSMSTEGPKIRYYKGPFFEDIGNGIFSIYNLKEGDRLEDALLGEDERLRNAADSVIYVLRDNMISIAGKRYIPAAGDLISTDAKALKNHALWPVWGIDNGK